MEKIITSSLNPFFKGLLKMKNKLSDEGLFLIEGEDLCQIAFDSGTLIAYITASDKAIYPPSISHYIFPDNLFKRISSFVNPAPIIGIAKRPGLKDIGNRVIYLDGVQDPGNVGTIIRTALSFGYDSVILSRASASWYNSKVIQASKGSIFLQNVLDEIPLSELKKKGYYIIGSALNKAQPLEDALLLPSLKAPFCLILGSEGQGISQASIDASDLIVKIEMDNIDSLNVAIAGGILMYQFRKR